MIILKFKKGSDILIWALFVLFLGFSLPASGEKMEGEKGGKYTQGPQYKRIQRDLKREYQAGGLTRTEYIQRLRELEDLYGPDKTETPEETADDF